jgi:hypothetical protein
MIPFQITIQIDPQTVAVLLEDGFQLVVLQATQGLPSGVPVAWFTRPPAETMVVSCTGAVQAYIAPAGPLAAGARIVPSASYPIDPGQTLQVVGPDRGNVTAGPAPGQIAILNQTAQVLTCGISRQEGNGPFTPTCAFPLFGQMMDLIAPAPQVFLMLCSVPESAGTVVLQSCGPGVLVDIAGAPQRTLSFNLNEGWLPGPGATVYPPGTVLVPLLIQAGQG